MRKYPSLVNCTSIDWFLSWPNEALLAVSDFYLTSNEQLIDGFTHTNVEVIESPAPVEKKLSDLGKIEEDEALES